MAISQNPSTRHTEILDHAASLTPAVAVELAKTHIERITAGDPKAGDLVEMGLYARGSADYRKELEASPELVKGAKDALTMGVPMPMADWKQAKELAGGNSGRVYLPKMLTEYAGKIVMVTNTHVVQQASKNTVIAHDLSKLEDRSEIVKLNAEGKLQGKTLKVSYGSMDGKAEVLTFTQVRANDILKDATAYASQSIKTPQARAAFLKHIEAMNAEKIAQSRTPNTPAQQPARAQQREQVRAR